MLRQEYPESDGRRHLIRAAEEEEMMIDFNIYKSSAELCAV
jgi:hypothetical protein